MGMGQLDSAMRDSASRQRAGILTMHTIWARRMFCAASLPCSTMAGGCLWLRAAPAACARWRQCCIRGSKI